jgi:nicotinate phosphoribosyltransferase
MAYKLVTYDGRQVLKTSAGKATFPGEKQVYRFRGKDARFAGDLLALRDEPAPREGEPLLRTVMAGGRLLAPHPSLAAVRKHCGAQLAALPGVVRRLDATGRYPVRLSDRLLRLRRSVTARVVAEEIAPLRRRAPARPDHQREEMRMARQEKPTPPRSPKAGRPPEEVVSPPRVRRRQKTAHAQVRKGTTLLETGHGPRVTQAARKPKVKKR